MPDALPHGLHLEEGIKDDPDMEIKVMEDQDQ